MDKKPLTEFHVLHDRNHRAPVDAILFKCFEHLKVCFGHVCSCDEPEGNVYE